MIVHDGFFFFSCLISDIEKERNVSQQMIGFVKMRFDSLLFYSYL